MMGVFHCKPHVLLTLISLCLCLAKDCSFSFQEAHVVGYGELLSYPGLWNNQGSTVLSVDRNNGNVLLYPQMQSGAKFWDNVANQSFIVDARKEIFLFFGSDGSHKWTAEAYSSTFPVVEDDVYILNEQEITKLGKADGETVWVSQFCTEYRSSGVKKVSDIFPVVHGDSDKVLAVGLLMTGRGWCQITVGGKVHNFTSDHPYDTDFSTPYIVYVLKSDGQALNYTKFAEVEADLVRSALRNGDTVTFLGMVMNSYDATVQHITQQSSDGHKKWVTTIRTPHEHNFLWSQSYADATNDHVLFISDPMSSLQLKAKDKDRELKHKGLLFGGIDVTTGAIAWQTAIEYKGVITSTFIQYMDKGLVVLGAIWDGEDDLDFGNVQLNRIHRPVQGMLGFFAVYDQANDVFLFVQEVAPELVYPGHHVGFFKLPDGTFEIVACPAFWDAAPRRLVDNEHSVELPRPETDSVVLVRYLYSACGSGATSRPHGRHHGARAASGKVATFMIVVLSVAFVLTLGAGGVLILKKQGYSLPDLGIPNLFGKGRGSYFLAATGDDDEDDDPLGDIDYGNDPL